MTKQKSIKIFIIHQFVMSDLQDSIIRQLQSCPFCTFVDMSCPKQKPIPEDKLEFIQEIACGKMMESDIVIVLPDTPKDYEIDDEDNDYISDFSDTFRSSRGLHQNSIYTVEIRTLMFDSCDTKPVLVLGWTKDSAKYLADKLRNPKHIDGRAYNQERFYAMGLNEVCNTHDIAKKIIAILDC